MGWPIAFALLSIISSRVSVECNSLFDKTYATPAALAIIVFHAYRRWTEPNLPDSVLNLSGGLADRCDSRQSFASVQCSLFGMPPGKLLRRYSSASRKDLRPPDRFSPGVKPRLNRVL